MREPERVRRGIAFMICIYPDCSQPFPDTEPGKRQLIDHINHDHDDAHVIIACHHQLGEGEPFTARTVDGTTGQPVEFAQVRSQCVRCGQFVVEDAT